MSKPLEAGDYKCCDGCLESFSSDQLEETGGEDNLILCSRCLEEYELSN
jgi:hypothetical protein